MARPAQRVEPGPGLRAGDFSYGRWAQYLLPQDIAAYRCLRQCALSTRQLGWRPFAQAIGGGTLQKPGIARQRLRRIYVFLASIGFLSCSETGGIVPPLVVVNEIPGRPTAAQINTLTARRLHGEGPPHAVVDEFLDFFAQEYKRKTGYAQATMLYHRRNAIGLLKTYSLGTLKHLTRFFFWHMDPPHALGSLVRRIALVAEECGEEDARYDPYTPEQQAANDVYNEACAEVDAAQKADADWAILEPLILRMEECEISRRALFKIAPPPPPAGHHRERASAGGRGANTSSR